MRFQVPNQGFVVNAPPDQVGPQALIAGNNVFVDLDGRLKTRLGPISVTGSSLYPPERVLGIFPYEDNNGIFYPVVGTPTRWQANIAGTWTDLSGGTLLTGDPNNQVRFTAFASNGLNHVLGVNNVNGMYEWDSTRAAYALIPAAPIARDVLTLANRVVTFNTVEGGNRHPFRVRWSAINDETSWPSLAFADLQDTGNSIIGAALTSQISCVIYRQFSAWLMQAVPGNDASAFVFERIPTGDHLVGPTGPGSIVVAEGYHYYFGFDGRIYQYNGQTIQPISQAIDPFLRSAYNNGFPTRYVSGYDPAYRQLYFFFSAHADGNLNDCITFDLRRQVFEVPWSFPFNVTAASEVTESTGPNWTNWVPATFTWPDITYASWDSIPAGTQLVMYSGTDVGNVDRWMVGAQDEIAAAPTPGPNWTNWVPGGFTWPDITYNAWTEIPGPTINPATFVDIPYSANWGLQRSQDEMSSTLVHYMEIYQQQAASAETVVAQLIGYFQPLGVGSEVNTVTTLTMQLADQTTFYQTTAPGPSNAQNIKSNLLQLILTSAGALGQLNFAGCTLFVDYDVRGDYTGNGPQ
jgi:hypothetical protein